MRITTIINPKITIPIGVIIVQCLIFWLVLKYVLVPVIYNLVAEEHRISEKINKLENGK